MMGLRASAKSPKSALAFRDNIMAKHIGHCNTPSTAMQQIMKVMSAQDGPAFREYGSVWKL